VITVVVSKAKIDPIPLKVNCPLHGMGSDSRKAPEFSLRGLPAVLVATQDNCARRGVQRQYIVDNLPPE
jgi:hypothetical protein